MINAEVCMDEKIRQAKEDYANFNEIRLDHIGILINYEGDEVIGFLLYAEGCEDCRYGVYT